MEKLKLQPNLTVCLLLSLPAIVTGLQCYNSHCYGTIANCSKVMSDAGKEPCDTSCVTTYWTSSLLMQVLGWSVTKSCRPCLPTHSIHDHGEMIIDCCEKDLCNTNFGASIPKGKRCYVCSSSKPHSNGRCGKQACPKGGLILMQECSHGCLLVYDKRDRSYTRRCVDDYDYDCDVTNYDNNQKFQCCNGDLCNDHFQTDLSTGDGTCTDTNIDITTGMFECYDTSCPGSLESCSTVESDADTIMCDQCQISYFGVNSTYVRGTLARSCGYGCSAEHYAYHEHIIGNCCDEPLCNTDIDALNPTTGDRCYKCDGCEEKVNLTDEYVVLETCSLGCLIRYVKSDNTYYRGCMDHESDCDGESYYDGESYWNERFECCKEDLCNCQFGGNCEGSEGSTNGDTDGDSRGSDRDDTSAVTDGDSGRSDGDTSGGADGDIGGSDGGTNGGAGGDSRGSDGGTNGGTDGDSGGSDGDTSGGAGGDSGGSDGGTKEETLWTSDGDDGGPSADAGGDSDGSDGDTEEETLWAIYGTGDSISRGPGGGNDDNDRGPEEDNDGNDGSTSRGNQWLAAGLILVVLLMSHTPM